MSEFLSSVQNNFPTHSESILSLSLEDGPPLRIEIEE